MSAKPTALLVEDDENDKLFLEQALRDVFALSVATSLVEAVYNLELTKPELVLLDLQLPDSKFPDTLAEILKVRGEATIVIVSGRGDDAFMANCIKSGAHGFLFKNRLPHLDVIAEINRAMATNQIELSTRRANEMIQI